jgi:hypothetical protein
MTPEEHLLLRDLVRESCRPSPYWHSLPAYRDRDVVERDIEWLKQREYSQSGVRPH